MITLIDLKNRSIRLSDERKKHFESDHPEMKEQFDKIKQTLISPDVIALSNSDESIEMFYKFYEVTPVTSKYLCVLIKNTSLDSFVLTSYFTNAIKKGEILWKRK